MIMPSWDGVTNAFQLIWATEKTSQKKNIKLLF